MFAILGIYSIPCGSKVSRGKAKIYFIFKIILAKLVTYIFAKNRLYFLHRSVYGFLNTSTIPYYTIAWIPEKVTVFFKKDYHSSVFYLSVTCHQNSKCRVWHHYYIAYLAPTLADIRRRTTSIVKGSLQLYRHSRFFKQLRGTKSDFSIR